MAERDEPFPVVPVNFELGFGLPPHPARDPASQSERSSSRAGCACAAPSTGGAVGRRRARHRSQDGPPSHRRRLRDRKGAVLQPVLYALVLERLLPQRVASGRLHYCTADAVSPSARCRSTTWRGTRSAHGSHHRRRRGAKLSTRSSRAGPCDYCEYRVVCGPYEAQRTGRKPNARSSRWCSSGVSLSSATANQGTLIDAEARRRIREDLDTTLVVEAAAAPARPVSSCSHRERAGERAHASRAHRRRDFTEKAAGEMKLRLRAEIESARRQAAKDDRTRAALEQRCRAGAARIGTIHGFCADLLRERPIEARVDPSFRVLDERARGSCSPARSIAGSSAPSRISGRRAPLCAARSATRSGRAPRLFAPAEPGRAPRLRHALVASAVRARGAHRRLAREMDPLAALADARRTRATHWPRTSEPCSASCATSLARELPAARLRRARAQLATLAKNRDVY